MDSERPSRIRIIMDRFLDKLYHNLKANRWMIVAFAMTFFVLFGLYSLATLAIDLYAVMFLFFAMTFFAMDLWVECEDDKRNE